MLYLEGYNLLKHIEYYDGEIELFNNWGVFFLQIGDLICVLCNLEDEYLILKKIKRLNTSYSEVLKQDIENVRRNLIVKGFRIEIREDQCRYKMEISIS